MRWRAVRPGAECPTNLIVCRRLLLARFTDNHDKLKLIVHSEIFLSFINRIKNMQPRKRREAFIAGLLGTVVLGGGALALIRNKLSKRHQGMPNCWRRWISASVLPTKW